MGKVLLDMVMSLDGFVSGPDGGDDGLHDWYFAPAGNAPMVIAELVEGIGAMILGRGVFGEQPEGFDTPYKVPHFVLTHEARPSIERDGVRFIFITDGIERLLQQAQSAAGDRIVCVAGGASTAQQFLRAGLVDEVQLHVVDMLLGSGLRLFDNAGATNLERTRVLESPGVTHLRYSVVK
jgi:dihydrofolate reductase